MLKNTRSMTSLTDIVDKAIVCSLWDLFSFVIYFQRCVQGRKKGREREILEKEGKQNHIQISFASTVNCMQKKLSTEPLFNSEYIWFSTLFTDISLCLHV